VRSRELASAEHDGAGKRATLWRNAKFGALAENFASEAISPQQGICEVVVIYFKISLNILSNFHP